jgi:NADP-dependent aldehyde dehydrogenase
VEQRRDLLHSIAGGLEAARAELVGVAQSETGLSVERLDGEISRTAGQLRLYGDHVAAGKHLSARRSPGAGPGGVDVWTVDVPIGPVAVFAASNFPFAFGVPGGDTASALAAGCPVIVKGHPAQPVLSKRLAEIVGAAVDASGAPEGTFGFVDSDSAEDPKSLSLDLVRHPAVRAVGFTGSLGGGRALMDAAAARPDPIPVYAEMSSVNPVFVLPDAARDEKWAGILAGAVLGSAGQLCTKPGLIFVPAGPAGKVLGDAIEAAVEASDSLTMLTQGMAEGVLGWRGAAVGAAVDATVGAGEAPNEPTRLAKPFAVQIEAGGGRLPAEYVEEHFGPTTVVVHADPAAYAELAEGLDGQLTATIIADDSSDADRAAARALLPTLTGKAGRVVWNNVPTGVAVVEAMQHGGPWPATSAPWSTSVGTEAIKRFVRPVAMQGVPEDLAG